MKVILSFDVDWAPDFMVEEVYELLKKHNVRGTFLGTHSSPLMDKIARDPSCELGIHPNFFASSSHGKSFDEVLGFMKENFPSATSCRTHGLFQFGSLFGKMREHNGITVDSSIFAPGMRDPKAFNVESPNGPVTRIPFVFADDAWIEKQCPELHIDLKSEAYHVILFHPVHVYLNSSSPWAYREMRKVHADVASISEETASRFKEKNIRGTRQMLEELLAKKYLSFYLLKDVELKR